MASDIFRILVQSELSILPVTSTQMIAYTEFFSRQCFCMYVKCANRALTDDLIYLNVRYCSLATHTVTFKKYQCCVFCFCFSLFVVSRGSFMF